MYYALLDTMSHFLIHHRIGGTCYDEAIAIRSKCIVTIALDMSTLDPSTKSHKSRWDNTQYAYIFIYIYVCLPLHMERHAGDLNYFNYARLIDS